MSELPLQVWQSRVETNIAYFDCVTTFEALWRRASIKGGAMDYHKQFMIYFTKVAAYSHV